MSSWLARSGERTGILWWWCLEDQPRLVEGGVTARWSNVGLE